MVFMCTPSILYDVLGGRYLSRVPSPSSIDSICCFRSNEFALATGLPICQRAPVTVRGHGIAFCGAMYGCSLMYLSLDPVLCDTTVDR